MKKVLLICTAKICRSPMAQAIFDVSAADEGLPLRSESVGTARSKRDPWLPTLLQL